MAEEQVLVTFKSLLDDPAFEVSSEPVVVPTNFGRTHLTHLLNEFLVLSDKEPSERPFEFLHHKEILRGTVEHLITTKKLTSEDVIELEYTLMRPAPEQKASIPQPDWVGAVCGLETGVVTGGYDGLIRVLDNSDQPLSEGFGHDGAVVSLLNVRGDKSGGAMLSGSQDMSMRLWEWADDWKRCRCSRIYLGHEGTVESICSGGGDVICSASADRTLRLWSLTAQPEEESAENVSEPKPSKKKRRKTKSEEDDQPAAVVSNSVATLTGHTDKVTGVVWWNNEVYSTSYDRSLRGWDPETCSAMRVMHGDKPISGMAVGRSHGLIATAHHDHAVRIWDPRTQEASVIQKKLTGHREWVSSVDWTESDSNMLVSGCHGGVLKMWDLRAAGVIHTKRPHTDKVLCVDWDRSNRIISGGADCKVNVLHAPLL
eukprot:Rmarinus@m.15837